MEKDVIIIVSLLVIGFLLIALGVFMHYRGNKQVRETQRIITDKALLRIFEAQPGGLLSLDMMVEKTGLPQREALVRM